MKTFRNVAYLGLGTAAKMTAGLFTLVVIARVLGPKGFGTLMIFLSAAGVLCIVSSLGINTYMLREIGRSPEWAASMMSDALTAKITLAFATICLAGAFAICSPMFAEPAFGVLLLALLAESFTEFFNVGLRAVGNFSTETKQSMLAAVIYSATVAAIALVSSALLPIAIAYAVSRLAITIVAYTALQRKVGMIRPASVNKGLHCLCSTMSYSLDAALSSLFGQIDGLVLGANLSAPTVGVYQAGLRIYMSVITGAGILTNVLLPKASAEMVAGHRASIGNGRVILLFSAFGNLVGWSFALVLPHFVGILYGPEFISLRALMPWFGALFAARLVAGGWGLLLTAAGDQKYRAIISITHWIVIALVAARSIDIFGALGWIAALLVGTTVMTVFYAWRAVRLTASPLLAIGSSVLPIALVLYAFAVDRGLV